MTSACSSLRRHNLPWTTREDHVLERAWGTATIERLAARLGRTPRSLYWRARELGLKRGAQRGTEFLSHAARRTGYDTATLRKVLAASNVSLSAVMTPRQGRKGWRRHTVDPFDVDEAVKHWLSLEVVHQASARHGTTGETLRAWLVAAGHRPPPRKHRWRLPTHVIDHVATAYRATATVAAHARRVGLTKAALGEWLREAGVLGRKRPGVKVRLPAPVVDRVVYEKLASSVWHRQHLHRVYVRARQRARRDGYPFVIRTEKLATVVQLRRRDTPVTRRAAA